MAHNKSKGAIPKANRPLPVNSSKTKRTPPQQNAKARPSKLRTSLGQAAAANVNESVYQCTVCSKTDNVNKICCDGCNLWSHFRCAGITNEMLNKDQWFCSKCQTKTKTSPVNVSINTTIASANVNTTKVAENQPPNPNVTKEEATVRPNVETVNVITTKESIPIATSIANPVNLVSDIIASTVTPKPSIEVNVKESSAKVNPLPDQTDQNKPVKAHSVKPPGSHKTKSAKSTSSSAKIRNLAIQRLEEEERLRRERDKEELRLRREQEREYRERQEQKEKEYLDKKYSLLAVESDDSLSYDGSDERFDPTKIDPATEAKIDLWLHQTEKKDLFGYMEPQDNAYNFPPKPVLQDVPQMSSTNELEPKRYSNSINNHSIAAASNANIPTVLQQLTGSNAPSNQIYTSSAEVPSTMDQLNIQSSTSQLHIPASSTDTNVLFQASQSQTVLPIRHSAIVVSDTLLPNYQPINNVPNSMGYPSYSLASSTFAVNPPLTLPTSSGSQINPPFMHPQMYSASHQPIMSSYQQPQLGYMTSQNYFLTATQQQQTSSNAIPTLGHQVPVSNQLNYQPVYSTQQGPTVWQTSSNAIPTLGYQVPVSNQLNYQPVYSTQQGPTVSLPSHWGNTNRQNNVYTYSSIPVTTGQQPNASFNSNSTMNMGAGVNSQVLGSQSTLNNNRRLTAEQIAARQTSKDLPYFHGDVNEWQMFISSYENANEVCGYNNHENLNRLMKCLKGEAREFVKSLLVHADAVPEIIRTLTLIYGRPEVVIESMIQDIQKEAAPKDDDLASIMRFAIKVKNLSRTICNTGAVEHLHNTLLIKAITDKLPAQLLLQWAWHKKIVGVTDLAVLGNWLNDIAEAASLVVRLSSKTNSRKNDQRDNKNQQKGNSPSSSSVKTGTYLNTHVESASKKNSENKEKKCPACKNETCTKMSSCKKFKELNRNERLSIVKDNKLCTRCLGSHHFFRCRSNFKCRVDSCNANHHTMLHNNEKPTDPSSTNSTPKASDDKNGIKNSMDKFSSNASRSNVASAPHKQRVDKFRIVPVILSYKGKSINDFAYLDDGSNMTSMEISLANELNVNGTSSPICVEWAFGDIHTFDSEIVSIKVSGCYEGAKKFELNNVRTVSELHLPSQSITSTWLKQFDYLNGIPISTYESAKPRMLIGLQYSHLMVSHNTVEGKADEPVACKTRLGWVIQGPSHENSEQSNHRYSMNMCKCQVDDNNLHQLVKDYFQSENLGIKMPSTMLDSKENQRAKYIMESTTSKVDGRYETGLLWKDDPIELPNSYPMALKRLQCLESKMAKDPKLAENLRNQMQQFIDKKYIRKLTPEELRETNDTPIWYLPTFPAFNPKKPEKVRIVWDGAAKVMNISLNSLLLTGPDQLVPLPDILRKFRERLYAILGDIKEMYHQIKIIKADQNVQRFLWRDGDQSKEPDVYVLMVVSFGLTCSPSQAQYIKNKNALEFITMYPEAVDTIINKHYVDDMLDCEHTIDAAEKRIQQVKLIHKEGGFEIRNFLSNSKELLQRIGETSDLADKNMNISIELGTERVLGMFWNAKTDCFTFSLKYTKINEQILTGKHHPTKREVLRVLMSVFDPLGLLANYLIHTKILLQEIWRTKVDWDEKITQPNFKKWTEWIKTLSDVENIHIPRLYSPKLSPNAPKSIQLHTFVDAGAEAYATTVFLRFEDDDGVDCCLASAKTKVAPNKPISIPRLELQGAVLGTRLANSVMTSQTFKIDKFIYWTDSLTVMGWINSEARRYNQFVAFRMGEILESTEPNQWRWVPSEHNVADEATKSKEIAKLNSSSRWYKAPDFLYDNEETWFNDDIEHFTEEEIRPAFVMAQREIVKEELTDLNRFSQWNRLLRAQAYVFRFIHNARHKKHNRRLGTLKKEEIERAENYLYRRAQMDHFIDEIMKMRHNQRSSSQPHKDFDHYSSLRTVSPYLDEYDVIRMKVKSDEANAVLKRPVILPQNHRITQLITDYYHRRLEYPTALKEIRKKFMILETRLERVTTSSENKTKRWLTDDIQHYIEEEIRPSFAMAQQEIVRKELVDLTRFSNWNRLMRTQAYVFRFIYNTRQKQCDRRCGPLKQEEMKRAENYLYRRAQMDEFLDEILVIRHNQRSSLERYKDFDRSSSLRTFSPYLDEYDVIRMKGRIDAASAVSYETKRPIILPRKHRITQLIVDYYHRRYKHANHSTAMNEIRQKYAIPALRVVMKGIRTSCQRCKNLLADPKIPEMAELPPGRLATYTLPFTYVGVDYFGPLRVRNGRKTRNRPVIMEKRWVLIFTCLTTRAIWMEIAHSMDTNSCIMCIDNFMLRKGQPREIHSDNGTSFHSSDIELSEEFAKIDQNKIEERFTNSEMVWKFNPPATPHMGGVWERLILTVKTCLKETMKTRTPNDEMLKNLIVEAEYIVNSRPLTYVSLESADDEALTPNHILLGSSNGVKPLGNINERDLARNTYKAVQVLAHNFWHRFVLEYLPTLTKRTKWFKPAEPIKLGDVVVVVDEKSQRNSWPKGIVEELLPGKKGIIRQVMVRTAKGIRKRSVSKLAVLDVKPPSHEAVNRNEMGSINGEGYVGQRHLNVNESTGLNSSTALPD